MHMMRTWLPSMLSMQRSLLRLRAASLACMTRLVSVQTFHIYI